MADFELEKFKWGTGVRGEPGGVVQWSFAQSPGAFFSFDRAFTEPDYQKLVRDAFGAWEAVIDITFVEVSDSASVAFRLGWDAIDGPLDVVGTTQYTGTATTDPLFTIDKLEIRFDTAEAWSLNQTSNGNSINFYTTALHEIGHAIGLKHADNQSTVMYPIQQDDVLGQLVMIGLPSQGAIKPLMDWKALIPQWSAPPKMVSQSALAKMAL